MEWLIAIGLGIAAGTNAYIPLLVTGALAKWTGAISLPESWSWLESEWTLSILAVLIVLEFVAQRIPGIATVADIFHTALRPTAAGIVVSAQGASASTVTDWDTFWSDGQWIPIAIAVGIALTVHLTKVVIRVTADAMTGGVAGGAIAAVDEGSSVVFSLSALLAPVLIPLLLVSVGVSVWWWRRRKKTRRPDSQTLND